MKLEESYLYGLIAGRGHLYKDSKIIAIEFSHSNEFVDGIAHCPKCGWLATKPKGNEDLKCKNHNCENIVDRNVKKRYNQPQSTINSLNKYGYQEDTKITCIPCNEEKYIFFSKNIKFDSYTNKEGETKSIYYEIR
jgi:hypothetical protein